MQVVIGRWRAKVRVGWWAVDARWMAINGDLTMRWKQCGVARVGMLQRRMMLGRCMGRRGHRRT